MLFTLTQHFLVVYLQSVFVGLWYAIQHIPVPVPSQDKLGGLQQEGHPT